jgi:hypothetical protein
MTLLIRSSPYLLQQPPFRLVVGLVPPITPWMEAMQYFNVSPPQVLTYVLSNWALFSVAGEDTLYEEVIDAITSGHSIFRLAEQWERTQVFFRYTECMMDFIYFLCRQLYGPLRGAFNPGNERDATTFAADWLDQETVSIYVHPQLDPCI